MEIDEDIKLLYSDAPTAKKTAEVFHVKCSKSLPRELFYAFFIEVETDGLAYIQPHSAWKLRSFKNLDHDERMEVYEFLTEWEFLEWKRVGPEDSELFATEKLIGGE